MSETGLALDSRKKFEPLFTWIEPASFTDIVNRLMATSNPKKQLKLWGLRVSIIGIWIVLYLFGSTYAIPAGVASIILLIAFPLWRALARYKHKPRSISLFETHIECSPERKPITYESLDAFDWITNEQLAVLALYFRGTDWIAHIGVPNTIEQMPISEFLASKGLARKPDRDNPQKTIRADLDQIYESLKKKYQ